MSITLLPKWAAGATNSAKFSMRVLDTEEGQKTYRPVRGPAAVPPDDVYDGAVKIVASAAALATLAMTMI